jgi:uncharacterized protein (TIGR02246 family)
MELEQLTALEEIRQLKNRYIRAMDTHDWELMGACFTDDATTAFSDGLYSMHGRAEILDFFRRVVTNVVSSHVVSQPEIVFLHPGLARGVWRLEDTIVSGAPSGAGELRGAAYYYDEYTLVSDAWKIRHSGYRRIFKVFTPADALVGSNIDTYPTQGRYFGWLGDDAPAAPTGPS